MGAKSLTWVYGVEMMGLEPTTPCLQSRCSSQLSYIPGDGAAGPLSLSNYGGGGIQLTRRLKGRW